MDAPHACAFLNAASPIGSAARSASSWWDRRLWDRACPGCWCPAVSAGRGVVMPWPWSARNRRCGTPRRFRWPSSALPVGGTVACLAFTGQLVSQVASAPLSATVSLCYWALSRSLWRSPPGRTRSPAPGRQDRRHHLHGSRHYRTDVMAALGQGPRLAGDRRRAVPGRRRDFPPRRASYGQVGSSAGSGD